MLKQEQITSFNENGYLLVPSVLTKDEVTHLRKRILDIFSSGEWRKSEFNTERVLSDVYNTFPEFLDITLTSKIISIIRSILGPKPVLMPETAIHHKFYARWHKDSTEQEKLGHRFHRRENSLMMEAGFYLQDNTKDYGGGLTVMLGSHKTSDNFIVERTEPNLFQKVKNRIVKVSEEKDKYLNPHGHRMIDISSKAGDLVIFNFLTSHRATRPNACSIAELPLKEEKLAFFNAFSINNETANEYYKYIKSRPEPFYKYLNVRKPNPSIIAKASELDFIAL